jgi:hypothetical protein
MGAGQRPDDTDIRANGRDASSRRHNVIVTLNDEQMAAAEGWRSAHGISDRAEALGELVRLGLLGEIAKIYRLVGVNRSRDARERGDTDRPQP